jgi:DNA-binding MarR family transcriptional regulator
MDTDTEDRWMGAWLALIRTHARLWDHVEAQLRRDHGLTIARYDVLANLESEGGRLGLTELASAIVLSPSGLSKLLDRMASSGLVRREPDPADARSSFAQITPRGRRLVNDARRSHHALLQRRFGDALTNRDVADLTRIMTRVSAALARESAARP